MSERVRGVVSGVGLGLACLVLLDLARILAEAAATDGGDTSEWWPIACYVGVGLVVAAGVGLGRRDRVVPLTAAVVVALVALPAVPSGAVGWLPELPLVPSTVASRAVAFAGVGAFAYGAVRAGRS